MGRLFYLRVFLCQLENELNIGHKAAAFLCCFFLACAIFPPSLAASLSLFFTLCLSSLSHSLLLSLGPLGKPVMIVTEYMENGSLDTFLKVSMFYFAADDEGQLAPRECCEISQAHNACF